MVGIPSFKEGALHTPQASDCVIHHWSEGPGAWPGPVPLLGCILLKPPKLACLWCCSSSCPACGKVRIFHQLPYLPGTTHHLFTSSGVYILSTNKKGGCYNSLYERTDFFQEDRSGSFYNNLLFFINNAYLY